MVFLDNCPLIIITVNLDKLPFDFFLPEKNICIEYDGEQHYKDIFGNKSHKQTKINDSIKNKFCSENSINLIRIPYYNKLNLITFKQ